MRFYGPSGTSSKSPYPIRGSFAKSGLKYVKIIDEMSRKYIGKDYPWNQPGDERVIVKIRPEHATGQG